MFHYFMNLSYIATFHDFCLLCCSGSWSHYDDIIGSIEGKGVASVKYVTTLYIKSSMFVEL